MKVGSINCPTCGELIECRSKLNEQLKFAGECVERLEPENKTLKEKLHEMYVAFQEIDTLIGTRRTHAAQDIATQKWKSLKGMFE